LEEAPPSELYVAASSLPATRDATRSRIPQSTSRLLSPQGEQYLFRRFNCLKYRANVLRGQLCPDRPSPRLVAEIEELLSAAQQVRARIAEANLRLVASVARRFSRLEQDFEELVAEGGVVLLAAIDKFDSERGYRFSTYATHALQRHYFRYTARRGRRARTEVSTPLSVLTDVLGAIPPETSDRESLDRLRRLIDRWDECLSKREQQVLSLRFGLGSQDEERTLKSLSRDMGLSKERVRQIQMQALRKLRGFAEAHGLAVEL
jgi:RNA polymerase sigma factor (sigma-70 family)